MTLSSADNLPPRTIILGSNRETTAEYYKKLGLPVSTLITNCNQPYTTAHTSVHDIPNLAELETVLRSADQVFWAEPSVDEFAGADSFTEFLYWLQDYNLRYKNVKNFNSISLDPYNWKYTVPVLSDNDIVFLGSSTTAGVGLPDSSTWYSNLVAQHYGKKSVNLAETVPGIGNNDKTFDLYTQLNFCKDQIVVIQIAPIDRVRWCDDDAQLKDLPLRNRDIPNHRAMLTVFNRKYLMYKLWNQVRVMSKLAQAQSIRLVLWFDNYKIDSEFFEEQQCFYEFPEVISKTQLADYFLDSAPDHMHPGIKSNRFLADCIINHIEKLYS